MELVSKTLIKWKIVNNAMSGVGREDENELKQKEPF
jgi:hypothetical protein